jgi:antitoxin YefM
MTSITVTAARKDIYNLIARVNEDCKPVAITNSKGKGAVLVGEDDWAAIEETLYIMSVPGMTEKLITAHNEDLDDCVTADNLDW